MLEMKITIVAEDLTAAINNLANALTSPEHSAPAPRRSRAKKEQAPVSEQPEQPEAVATTNTEHEPGAPLNATPAQSPAPEVETVSVEPAQSPVINTAPVEVKTEAPKVSEKEYSLDEISRAGAALIDQGKMPDLLALLKSYGVQAVTLLDKSQYPAFVEDLRALGARI